MAFREVTVLEVREVLRLSRDGLPKKPLGRSIGGEPPTRPLPGLFGAGRRATTAAIAPPSVSGSRQLATAGP
jgi:hypothetical protein